jgi:hypothetical protein
LVVSALVRPAADGKTGAMVITLPLCLNLTEPILVTAKYGGDGYVLSRAIVPVQELDPNGAVVKIQVAEAPRRPDILLS